MYACCAALSNFNDLLSRELCTIRGWPNRATPICKGGVAADDTLALFKADYCRHINLLGAAEVGHKAIVSLEYHGVFIACNTCAITCITLLDASRVMLSLRSAVWDECFNCAFLLYAHAAYSYSTCKL